MQQVNNIVALVQASAKSTTPIKQEQTQGRRWKDSTEAMVILLFTRLADLFDSKAAAKGLVIFSDREKKIYSEKLELWCRKLDDLNTEDFKRGMTNLEKKAETDYREGNEMWPPSYAEFRALAFPKSGRDTQAHKVFDRPIGLEDQTAKAKRCELGIKNMSSLLAMLDQPSPETTETVVSYGKQQLNKAREMINGCT